MVGDDSFSWWEDKQVGVEISGAVVRGWVLSCRHVTGDQPPAAGRMTIVLMIAKESAASEYPATLTVDVYEDGGHGLPNLVRGEWPEGDRVDVHPRPGAAVDTRRPINRAR